MALFRTPSAAVAVIDPLRLADAQCALGRGDALALRWLGRGGKRLDLSYGELAEQADRCASLLLATGLAPGETVAVMVGRQPEAIIAALAIWKAGGVYCPIFVDLGPEPVRARLALGEARLLIASIEAYRHAVAPVRNFLPKLRDVLLLGEDEIPVGCLDFRAGMAAARPGEALSAGLELAGMMHFTSGTTAPAASGGAPPKAVLHDGSVVGFMADSARAAFGLDATEMLWCGGEPGWVVHTAYGLVAPLAIGAAVLLDEAPATPTRCLSVLEDEPVAVWYTTPTVIRGLIGGGAAPARSFRPRALRLAASVGEPLSRDAVEWGQKALGVPFRDTWWQTETGSIILAHEPSSPPVAGSMGRALPGIEVVLMHRELDGGVVLEAEAAATGELALRSATLPPWRSLGGEGGALPEELEGWHLSGDFVRRDADGGYWFLGREDEVIKSGGRMIGPFEVEAVLMSHPAVAEAGVVGAPDAQLNERIIAFIAVNPGFEPGAALHRELLAFARGHLGDSLAPHDIRFEQDLPRTPSGKIIRRLLKERLVGISP